MEIFDVVTEDGEAKEIVDNFADNRVLLFLKKQHLGRLRRLL